MGRGRKTGGWEDGGIDRIGKEGRLIAGMGEEEGQWIAGGRGEEDCGGLVDIQFQE